MTDSNEEDDKLAIPPEIADEDDDDDEDDPDITDIWNEEKLKAALGGLAPDVQKGPATTPTRKSQASVEVAAPDVVRPPNGDPKHQEGPGSAADTDPPPAPRGGTGLSWPLTIGLALTLAVAMYLLVRVLKG